MKDDRKIYWTLVGVDYYDLKIAPVLVLKFGLPAITPDEFFDPSSLVDNFALLLGIDASKIKRVQIVRVGTRVRRDTTGETNYVSLEISNDPVASVSDSASNAQSENSLKQITASVTNQILTGQLQEKAQSQLNISFESFAVTKPVTSSAENNTGPTVIQTLTSLGVVQEASGCRAQSPCDVQPILQALDQYVILFL